MSNRFPTRFLIRRRLVWLPTLWGGLTLVLIVCGLLLLAGRYANRWFSVEDPARGPDGRGARTLVVEGWMGPGDLDRALQTFRHGPYERIITTGGPSQDWPDPHGFKNYADRAADYLKRQGAPAGRLFSVPAPATAQDRTFLSAVMVREWGIRTGTRLDAIDVFSVGAHARRSRMVYRMAFGPSVEVGALVSQPSSFDAERWWTSSSGVKSIMGETLSIGWTICCFWPPPPGSQEERWAILGPHRAASAASAN